MEKNQADVTVNQDAPVIAAAQITVAAAPQTVWDVMIAIPEWPQWNPDIEAVTLQGPVARGTQFRWKSGPGTITSTLQHVEPPRLLAWTGTTMGIKAVHVWRIEPQGAGALVRTEESWEGLIVRLLRGRMQKTLEEAIEAGLRHLKAEAERRA